VTAGASSSKRINPHATLHPERFGTVRTEQVVVFGTGRSANQLQVSGRFAAAPRFAVAAQPTLANADSFCL